MTIVYCDKYLEHVQTPTHPESPQRLLSIRDALTEEGLWRDVLEPCEAAWNELRSAHDTKYLEFLSRRTDSMLTPDTQVGRWTYDIAKLAAGGGILAANQAWEGRRPSIALVRPPGHHAGAGYGMGFCYLNNIAIATKQMLSRAKRIAIVDIDVHHGNGTQEIFYESSEVLYVSIHQKHIFPGTGQADETGSGDGSGFTVNIPLHAGAGDASFDLAREKIILPILEEYRPDMLMVSIGTDAHYRDPLASLTLSSRGYAREIGELTEFARRTCSGRIAFFLEGGYDLPALSEVIACTVGLFDGRDVDLKFTELCDSRGLEREAIMAIAQLQKSRWKTE